MMLRTNGSIVSPIPLIGGNEKLFHSIFQMVPDIVYVYDLKTLELKYINSRVTDILGYTAQQMQEIGNTLFFGNNEEERTQTQQRLCSFFDTASEGEGIEYELSLPDAHNVLKMLRIRASVFTRDNDGHPLEVVCIAEDITEEKKREKEKAKQQWLLSESERIHQYGSWEWDIDTNTITWSEGLWRIFGYVPDAFELTYEAYMQLLTPEDQDRIQQLVNRAMTEHIGYEVEHQIVRTDGQVRTLLGKGQVMEDEQGKIKRLIGSATDITETKKAQERLHQSEFLLMEAEKNFSYGSWFFELDTYQVTWSYGMWYLLGFSASEIPRYRALQNNSPDFYYQFVHPDDVALVRQQTQIMIEQATIVAYDHRIITRQGECRIVNLKGKPTADGKRVMGSITDVTEDRKKTEKLIQSEALLSQTENILHYGSWSWNTVDYSISWSEGLWRLFGYSPLEHPEGEVEPGFYFKHIYPEDQEKVQKANEVFLQTGQLAEDNEHRIVRADGVVRVVENKVRILEWKEGRPAKIVGSTIDITDSREAAQRMQRMQKLLAEAESIMGYGSWEWTLPGDEITWSKGLYHIHEVDESTQIVFNTYLDSYVDEKDRDAFRDALLKASITGESFTLEYRMHTTTRQPKILVTKGQAVTNGRGVVTSLIGSVTDVTQLRHFQRELEDKITALNRSNQELEQFAYIASHDLQEPLRKIRAFAQFLQQRLQDKLSESDFSSLERMRESAQRMQIMIDTLLDFSRIGRVTQEFEKVDLNQVFSHVLDDLGEKIKETNATITVPKLPVVWALPSQMHQLFQNLVSNALKFSWQKPEIHLTVRQLEKTSSKGGPHLLWEITVADNGIGFEPEYADQMFILFRRLNPRVEYAGSGIGLAICKKIVESHGGQIRAEGEEGKGARFIFTLPVVE